MGQEAWSVGQWPGGDPPGSRSLTSGIWGHRVVERVCQEGGWVVASVYFRFASFMREVPLPSVSDGVPLQMLWRTL